MGLTPAPIRGNQSIADHNNRLAIEVFQSDGPMTVPDLSRAIGVSRVSAHAIVRRLLSLGIVRLAGERAGTRGPRAALYGLNAGGTSVIAVEVMTDAVRARLCDLDGAVAATSEAAVLEAHAPAKVADVIRRLVRRSGRGRAMAQVRIGLHRAPAQDFARGRQLLRAALERLPCPVAVEPASAFVAVAEGLTESAAAPPALLIHAGTAVDLVAVVGGRPVEGTNGRAGAAPLGWDYLVLAAAYLLDPRRIVVSPDSIGTVGAARMVADVRRSLGGAAFRREPTVEIGRVDGDAVLLGAATAAIRAALAGG
ncbi:hypothetical protein AB0J83_36600 [Actinoplanes sp. NPDC049596]|uniref:hypothetical protein n=1 Tax=unclassified Actinoplanes TaxID=2626549 RepID=UPI003423C36B